MRIEVAHLPKLNIHATPRFLPSHYGGFLGLLGRLVSSDVRGSQRISRGRRLIVVPGLAPYCFHMGSMPAADSCKGAGHLFEDVEGRGGVLDDR